MRDIAVRAGVSRSTVSFVLNQKHGALGISEATRRRVLRAASDLGYRRNELARSMVTGKNPVFAFLVSAPEVEVAARLLSGALEEAERHRHFVKVIRVPPTFDHTVIEQCVELRPTGVMSVYVTGRSLELVHEEMARYRIPVAVLDSSFPQPHGSRIISDDLNGCRQAIVHLTTLGHRRIAFIGGRPDTGAGAERTGGYQTVMAENGLQMPEGYLVHGNWDPPVIERVTQGLFERKAERPTAAFCADDKTAMVVCRTLRRLGLRVPDDVSVMGFADLTMAPFCDPPLTTVAQPFHEMGKAAVVRLLAAAEEMESGGKFASPYEELLPTRLVVRDSTAPVRPDAP
jgi:DNA-binding LacI/PurR family transcriptional regulator